MCYTSFVDLIKARRMNFKKGDNVRVKHSIQELTVREHDGKWVYIEGELLPVHQDNVLESTPKDDPRDWKQFDEVTDGERIGYAIMADQEGVVIAWNNVECTEIYSYYDDSMLQIAKTGRNLLELSMPEPKPVSELNLVKGDKVLIEAEFVSIDDDEDIVCAYRDWVGSQVGMELKASHKAIKL